ncbi:hypothetical protein ACFCZT_29715 [Streptomyces sp. NPDC056230]|uniref:hypothetical protein n=1 Tax=unclassified Streptomyces TaxID=2593676 RepID=UPI0035D95F3A
MPKNDFPQDLLDAQLALHQTWNAYEQYATTLPWSAEPIPGWEGDKQLHSSYQSHKEDSPGYTEEQAAEVRRFQDELRQLSAKVVAHPFWESVDAGDRVAARMALKHTHDPVGDEA